jgi:hypothetical protein
MSLRRAILHLFVWSCVFTLWLLATRQHHPSWSVAAAATALLIAGSACAVYLNALHLRPLLAKPGSWLLYFSMLAAAILLLDFIVVMSIQLVYDQFGVPREGRYGFWFNMASDGAIILMHLLAAMLTGRIANRRSNP